MAFTPGFTVTQSSDGASVVLTDTTNYGDGGFYNKSDFASRTLYITRGDAPNTALTVDFAFTNTNNAIQDTYSWTVTQDWVYSIKMILIDNSSVEYTFTSLVIITEYTNKKLRLILSNDCGCGCGDNCKLSQKIQCGLDAATARTCAADIYQAQRILESVNELADNHINC